MRCRTIWKLTKTELNRLLISSRVANSLSKSPSWNADFLLFGWSLIHHETRISPFRKRLSRRISDPPSCALKQQGCCRGSLSRNRSSRNGSTVEALLESITSDFYRNPPFRPLNSKVVPLCGHPTSLIDIIRVHCLLRAHGASSNCHDATPWWSMQSSQFPA